MHRLISMSSSAQARALQKWRAVIPLARDLLERLAELFDAVTVTAPCQHGRGGKPRKRAGLPALRGLRRMTVSWLTVHNSGSDFSQALPKRVPTPGYRRSRTNEPLTSRAFANETSDRTTLYSAPRDRAEIVRRLESSGCGITQGRASDASLLFSFSRSGNCKSRARFCGSFIDESERGPAGSHQFGPRYSTSSDTGIELAGRRHRCGRQRRPQSAPVKGEGAKVRVGLQSHPPHCFL